MIERKCEQEILIDHLEKIIAKSPTSKVGILSFYSRQVDSIEKTIRENMLETHLENLSFGTVDSFQGKEFDVVLLSIVRSNDEFNIGFLKSVRSRINVALSRARDLLIVFGDSKTISNNEVFASLIEKCRKGGYYEKIESYR